MTSVFVLLDHMESLGTLITSPGGITATHTIARAMLDIATGPWFLLEPGIGGRERVRRHMNLRLQSLKEQTHLETGTERTAIKSHAEGRIQRIVQAARTHGFDVRRERDRYQPPFLDTKLPTTTTLATQMFDPALGQLFWRLGSAVAHGQQHGISMFIEQIDQPVDPLHGDAQSRWESTPRAPHCDAAERHWPWFAPSSGCSPSSDGIRRGCRTPRRMS
ncbi:hypothetical protein [Streptomyces sp. NPDC058629]|uniref:hypothetical protein n=1 Tax=Streptomyces sp. NPDC058629 TaxID=3346565 RepID=UPI00365556BF